MSLWNESRPMIFQSHPGTVNLNKHANYPHQAGTLYDCERCESVCYCTDEFSCLACENRMRGSLLKEEC